MRKRKAKVVWLPADTLNRLGTAPLAITAGIQSQTIIKIFTGNPLGAPPLTEEIAIVKDFSGLNNVTAASASLADIESSGYRLRRIVGKLVFSVLQGAAVAGGDGSTFVVTAGFIVRRIDQESLTGDSLAATAAGAVGNGISVVTADNIADPWIWRRSWVLSDTLNSAVVDVNATCFPQSNAQYGGGNLDGPHVDAKTARVLGTEERLYLSVTVEGVNGTAQGAPGAVLLLGDLRVLGSLRSMQGNRRNAVR